MKPNEPKVSILVPVYNVEKYLRRCIGSIVNQTLSDIEILLLDDGSTDDSPAICDEYAASDTRIRVIHKANSGYGATMNTGLELAHGEYIGIIESDDWAEVTMYEELYTLAKKNEAQVVKSEFCEYADATGDKAVSLFTDSETGKVICPKEESSIFYAQPSIWSAIYRRSFLNEYGIRFLETPGASYQDISFNFKVWSSAERVWLEKQSFVHYRKDNSSASVCSAGKVFCVRDEWDEIERYMKAFPEACVASARLRTHVKFANYMWNVQRLKGAEKKAFQKFFLQEYREAARLGNTVGLHDSAYDKLRYLCKISPNPWMEKVLLLVLGAVRLIVKKKRSRNVWRIFGCIEVKGMSKPVGKATFWEDAA